MPDAPRVRLHLPVRPFRRHPSRPRTRAQALVEFAIILPVFLLLVVLAIDFGRLFFTNIQMQNSAREGANYASSSPTDDVGIGARVRAEANVQGQGGEGTLTISTTCEDTAGSTIACAAATGGAGAGNRITVQVQRPFSFLTPVMNGFFGGALNVTSSATATVLGYAPGSNASQPPGCTSPFATFTVINTGGRTIFANPAGSTPNSGVCNISGYNWDWGDGETTVGTATGDSHTYAADGTYTVVLVVTNQAGDSTASRTATVPAPVATPTPGPTATPTPGPTATPSPTPSPTPVACTLPTANFTWTKSGKTYTYRDASTVSNPASCPITDWLWTFTDNGGTQSNAQNPTPVTYGNNSSHPVTLRVTNAAGSRTITINT